jgi:hypothetical protein
VFTIECTRALLERLNRWPSSVGVGGPPTTRLGDWCANVVPWRGGQVVLLVSMRSLLPVLVPVLPVAGLLAAVRTETHRILLRLGVPTEIIEQELREMEEAALTRTTSRQILGSMSDFAWLAESHGNASDLTEVAMKLAEAPCRPIGMRSPRNVASELLRARE